MIHPNDNPKDAKKAGRAVGGAARMANLSPEQRQQLARAAAAARWNQSTTDVPKLSSRLTSRHDQAFVAKVRKELATLIQQRERLDRRILGLKSALEGYGIPQTQDEPAAVKART